MARVDQQRSPADYTRGQKLNYDVAQRCATSFTMPNTPSVKLTLALIADTKATGLLFFAMNPGKQYFARFVEVNPDGNWTFMLMRRGDGKVASFGYTPPAHTSTPRGVTRVFNERPQGQEFLAHAATEAFRSLEERLKDGNRPEPDRTSE